MQFGRRLALLDLDFVEFGVQALLHGGQGFQRFQAHRHFHHFGLVHAQQFARIVDMDVAVAPARPGHTIENAADGECPAID